MASLRGRGRASRSASRRRTSVAQAALGVARHTYGAARAISHGIAASVGAVVGGVGGHAIHDSTAAGLVGGAIGALTFERLTKLGTTRVGKVVGPDISGGDTNTLQNALNYAARSADKTATEAEPALAIVDRITATLEQAGGRQPPREIRDALQDLEDARKLLEEAAELGRSASADIDSVMYEIFST